MRRSKFLRDGRTCHGCGSSLLRQALNEDTGCLEITCFACSCNCTTLTKAEAELTYEEAMEVLGREFGDAGKIYTRLNTPGRVMSCHPGREEAREYCKARR